MFGYGKYLEVFKTVVGLVFVLVVDNFPGLKKASEVEFSYNSMREYISIGFAAWMLRAVDNWVFATSRKPTPIGLWHIPLLYHG